MASKLYESYNKINIPDNHFKIDYNFMDKVVRNMRAFIGITFILLILTIVVVLIDSSISNRIDLMLNI